MSNTTEKLLYKISKGNDKRTPEEQVKMAIFFVNVVLCMLLGACAYLALSNLPFDVLIKITLPALAAGFILNGLFVFQKTSKAAKGVVIQKLEKEMAEQTEAGAS